MKKTPRMPEEASRRLVIASWVSLALAVVVLFGLWPLIGGLHPFLVRHQVDVVVLTKS